MFSKELEDVMVERDILKKAVVSSTGRARVVIALANRDLLTSLSAIDQHRAVKNESLSETG